MTQINPTAPPFAPSRRVCWPPPRQGSGPSNSRISPEGRFPALLGRFAQPLDIGVDLDGVCYDFFGALRLFISRTTGRPVASMPGPTTWNFFEDDWGLTVQEFLDFCHAGVNAGHIFRVGKPYPGVVDGLAALAAAGHRIHIVTDRGSMGAPGAAEANTLAWLREEEVRFTTLTISKDKTSVPTDVFIDDRPENVTALAAAGVDVFLREQPYNASFPFPAHRRVPSFTAFLHGLEERAQAA